MLYLDFTSPVDAVEYNPGGEFDDYVEKSWFNDPLVIKIAETIDRVRHVTEDIFENSRTGKFQSRDLSGGAKTVIMAYICPVPGMIYPLSWLGENCYPLLSLIPDSVDATFYADAFPNLDEWGCSFVSKETGDKIHDYYTYRKEYITYVL